MSKCMCQYLAQFKFQPELRLLRGWKTYLRSTLQPTRTEPILGSMVCDTAPPQYAKKKYVALSQFWDWYLHSVTKHQPQSSLWSNLLLFRNRPIQNGWSKKHWTTWFQTSRKAYYFHTHAIIFLEVHFPAKGQLLIHKSGKGEHNPMEYLTLIYKPGLLAF